MLAKVFSAGLMGIDAYPIEIEVDVSGGLPKEVVVGLPDAAVKESKDRVHAAINNSGFERTIPIWSVNGLANEIIEFLDWKRDHGESIHPRSPLFCSKSNKIRVNKRISDR